MFDLQTEERKKGNAPAQIKAPPLYEPQRIKRGLGRWLWALGGGHKPRMLIQKRGNLRTGTKKFRKKEGRSGTRGPLNESDPFKKTEEGGPPQNKHKLNEKRKVARRRKKG